jgi:hypothetical protein
MKETTETNRRDRRVLLSTLWIFAVLNYLYADVITLFFNRVLQKEAWREFGSGYVGSIRITQGFVLATAVLMETAIAMVLLSRVLSYRPNRWANVGAGVLHTAAVAWSLSGGDVNVFYVFFAVIEIACTLFIVWYAWTWPRPANRVIPVADVAGGRSVDALTSSTTG